VIAFDIIARLRSAVCAIGYLKVPLEQHANDPQPSHFHIEGTGFLVRSNVVITTRRILRLATQQAENAGLPSDRLLVRFDQTGTDENAAFLLCTFMRRGYFSNAAVNLGAIEVPPYEEGMPVTLGETLKVQVSQDIGALGYAYGNRLLQRDDDSGELRPYRAGPILQQGYISALAPHPSSARVERLLLDLATQGRMSGSPIFDSRVGTVIGVHEAVEGAEGVTAFAMPLTTSLVNAICEPLLRATSETPVIHTRLPVPVRDVAHDENA
jgi:hypothetical protein